jgi:VanZ family protein
MGVVLVVLAAFVCLAPGRDIPGGFQFNDKLWHAVGHLALTIYFCGLVPRLGWYKVVAFLLAFGIGIEIAQHFMQMGREADKFDILANTTGMALGLGLSHFGMNRWPHWVAWTLGRRSVS